MHYLGHCIACRLVPAAANTFHTKIKSTSRHLAAGRRAGRVGGCTVFPPALPGEGRGRLACASRARSWAFSGAAVLGKVDAKSKAQLEESLAR